VLTPALASSCRRDKAPQVPVKNPLQQRIAGAIDDAHTTPTEFGFEPLALVEEGPNHFRHFSTTIAISSNGAAEPAKSPIVCSSAAIRPGNV
jgi:hypothetical protein